MAGRLNSWRWAVCVLAVVALHALIGRGVAEHMAEFNDAAAMPPRIAVAYVRDMEMTAPTAAAPMARAPTLPAPQSKPKPVSASPAASQPQLFNDLTPPESETVKPAEALPKEPPPPLPPSPPTELPPAQPLAEVKPPVPEPVDAPSASAAEAAPTVVPSGQAAAAVEFSWPGATRLSYVLTGNYRGEINGKAQVEWVRMGARYQVHLDVLVGSPVAPLITRRMSSEGTIAPEGLVPERFDEDTKIMFRDRRRLKLSFDADSVVLAKGERQPRPAGVQDSASQFVQLSYLFSIQPELLAVGRSVVVPLALARKIDTWTYDVVAEEPLFTRFGEVASYHLKPRKAGQVAGQVSNDLTAEIWIAPSLQYLPARIRIRQDADTFIDMLIERKPQLAAAIEPSLKPR